MFFVQKSILNISNYQLDRCFPEIVDASYGDKFADLAGPDDFTRLSLGVFWWLINIQPGYLIFCKKIHVRSSLTCPVILLGSSAMINYMSATPTLASTLVKIFEGARA